MPDFVSTEDDLLFTISILFYTLYTFYSIFFSSNFLMGFTPEDFSTSRTNSLPNIMRKITFTVQM
jgi:hypothetical protein